VYPLVGRIGALPRDLGDVLDYLLPVSEASETPAEPSDPAPRPPDDARPGPQRPPALPIVAVPIGGRDVVRAAFAWNLAVEVARLGGSAALVAPREAKTALLWPDPGRGPVESPADGRALLRWVLLFTSLEPRDLMETYGLAKRLLSVSAACRVGITVHGVRHIQEAAQAFDLLAGVSARNLGRPLVSYGLLLDDLQVYRAIVSRRPIGIEHPQSRAARALSDVARLLLEDARDMAVA
jgi:hypothetical protein